MLAEAELIWSKYISKVQTVRPYDFCDTENEDWIVETSQKNRIYSLTQNVTEFVKVWMN